MFFRLNVVPVSVPPLRERREDIPLLATEFMRRLSRKHGVHVKGFTDAALRMLNEHSWPGNVRELQNVVERAVIMCGDNGMLEPEHLGLAINYSAMPAPSPRRRTAAPARRGERHGRIPHAWRNWKSTTFSPPSTVAKATAPTPQNCWT